MTQYFRLQTDKLRQISTEEFYKLFNNNQIVLTRDQDEQLPSDLIFPETLGGSGGPGPVLVRAGGPQIFLFDDEAGRIFWQKCRNSFVNKRKGKA